MKNDHDERNRIFREKEMFLQKKRIGISNPLLFIKKLKPFIKKINILEKKIVDKLNKSN